MPMTIRDLAIDPAALDAMRDRGGEWAAYENQDMAHSQIGHMQFLKVGAGCTYEQPPEHMPDGEYGPGWRYRFVGMVCTSHGVVTPF